MDRAEFRIPSGLKARAQAEADYEGLDLSEYIRQAVLARIVWGVAMKAGADPTTHDGYRRILDELARVSRELGE